MSVQLSWLSGNQTIDVAFDAVVTETHTASAQITTHPVERGVNVADHVYCEPLHLSLEAIVSNTPLSTPATHSSGSRGEVQDTEDGASALQFSSKMARPIDVWLDLKDAFEAKRILTVVTAVGQYDDMVMVGLSSPREAGSGLRIGSGDGSEVRVDKLTFSIEMQQIRVVNTREGQVARRPAAGTQEQKTNAGDKPKQEADPYQSDAYALKHGS